MKQQIISGIKLGFVIAFLLTSYVMYDGIWGPTFFGIQVQEYSQPVGDIRVYESFQDIRDPENSEWITAAFPNVHDSHPFYLKRKIKVENSSSEKVLEYYYKELKTKKLFSDIKLMKEEKRILFSKFMIDGAIIVVDENPIIILINVGRSN